MNSNNFRFSLVIFGILVFLICLCSYFSYTYQESYDDDNLMVDPNGKIDCKTGYYLQGQDCVKSNRGFGSSCPANYFMDPECTDTRRQRGCIDAKCIKLK